MLSAAVATPAMATEGNEGPAQKPGATIGASSGIPGPGLYAFIQVFTYNADFVGPGVGGGVNGTRPQVHAAVNADGILWVPGWNFMGWGFDAVLVQPFVMQSEGPFATTTGIGPGGVPFTACTAGCAQQAGFFNTFGAVEWSLNDIGGTGFGIKTGVGVYMPDGTISGPAGLNDVAQPWTTFQPELVLSYLKDGWNLTAFLYVELHTENTKTHYQSGDIFHADITATKTIGKWTFGPVAYYWSQISNDDCSDATCIAFYGPNGTAGFYNSTSVWAVGALVGYNFGPVSISVWGSDEVSAHVGAPDPFSGSTTQGWTVFMNINFALWTPEAPEPVVKRPLIYK
jgi:hypothetical protein